MALVLCAPAARAQEPEKTPEQQEKEKLKAKEQAEKEKLKAKEQAEKEKLKAEAQRAKEERGEEAEPGVKGLVKSAEADEALTRIEETDEEASLSEPSTVTLAEVAAEAPIDKKLPKRLGPVRLKIGETNDWIGFGFATQLEFDYEQFVEGAGQAKESDIFVELRRLRFTLSSSFLDKKIRTSLQLNFVPDALELIDIWFAFRPVPKVSLRMGQFKVPYDRYRAQSFAALSFSDWATTTRMFGSGRQIGLEVFGTGKNPSFEYAAGVFTGVNARAAHGVGIADIYGEIPFNRSDLADGDPTTAVHPALIGRVARNVGKINTDANTDVVGGKIRQSFGLGFAWDARPVATVDLPLRLSAEWLAKLYHVHINVVGYIAWFEEWTTGNYAFGPWGLMAETGYRFTRLWELAIRYSLTYITNALQNDAAAYAAAQIAAAPDPAQAAIQYADVGEQISQDQLALVLNAYVIGKSLRTLLEGAWESLRLNEGRRNAFRLTVQVQLVF